MFTTCGNGHDLTVPHAYIYNSNGTRECRQCSPKTTAKKGIGTWSDKHKKGSFA